MAEMGTCCPWTTFLAGSDSYLYGLFQRAWQALLGRFEQSTCQLARF
jgi:hypothetical protein